MALERKLVKAEPYQGRVLEARHMGPDLLGFVTQGKSSIELPGFFVDVEAALAGGRRFVDAEEVEKAKRAADQRKK